MKINRPVIILIPGFQRCGTSSIRAFLKEILRNSDNAWIIDHELSLRDIAGLSDRTAYIKMVQSRLGNFSLGSPDIIVDVSPDYTKSLEIFTSVVSIVRPDHIFFVYRNPISRINSAVDKELKFLSSLEEKQNCIEEIIDIAVKRTNYKVFLDWLIDSEFSEESFMFINVIENSNAPELIVDRLVKLCRKHQLSIDLSQTSNIKMLTLNAGYSYRPGIGAVIMKSLKRFRKFSRRYPTLIMILSWARLGRIISNLFDKRYSRSSGKPSNALSGKMCDKQLELYNEFLKSLPN